VVDLLGGPRIVAAHGGGIWTYGFDAAASDPTFAAAELTVAYDPADIDILPDADLPFQIADEGRTPLLTDLIDAETSVGSGPGDAASNVAAQQLGDGTWIVGWITTGGAARVAWGSESSGFSVEDVNVDGTPNGIAVWANVSQGVVAVTTESDVGVGIYSW
jgi:hypothetical protein